MPVTSLRLPKEFRKSLLAVQHKREVFQILREGRLSTVCEEAKCPNIGECFSKKTATFMIMGDRCTRRCHFCSVTTKKPLPLDEQEPHNVALACQKLGLDYVVITSVDRDELDDFGAEHFVRTVMSIKALLPEAKVELLVPDFRGRIDLIHRVLKSPITVFGHNIETCARLYKNLRPQSSFEVTKNILKEAALLKRAVVKSGMMVGLGEHDEEVFETLNTLRDLGVEVVTIGQYLRPSLKHWPVHRYVSDDAYVSFVEHGKKIGLRHVFAGPFVRSSYRAKEAHVKAFLTT